VTITGAKFPQKSENRYWATERDLYSGPVIGDLLTNCAATYKGTLGLRAVPAGTFQTCTIPHGEYTTAFGRVPFLIVNEHYENADYEIDSELLSYQIGD
jgi:hypothetical protein